MLVQFTPWCVFLLSWASFFCSVSRDTLVTSAFIGGFGLGLSLNNEGQCGTTFIQYVGTLELQGVISWVPLFQSFVVLADQLDVLFCVFGESQITGIKVDVGGWDCSMSTRSADTFLGFYVIISRVVLSSLTSFHYLFSRGVFVLGSQILTRRHLVPWKSSWHIVHRAVLLPVREKHTVKHIRK